MSDPLITVAELDSIDSPVVFADVRWYLGEPDRGRVEYEQGHIPDALFVDLEQHLSQIPGDGRHPLPTRQDFAMRLGRLGFDESDMIVAYDDRGGAVAARLWWMLRDIGHRAVWVLDGGLQAWLDAGRELESGFELRPQARMQVAPGVSRHIDREELASRLGSVTLLDARAGERYRGETEPIDPKAGHIPTAINAELTGNLDESGRFKTAQELRQRYSDLGVTESVDTVVYCGSGVNACHNAMALVRAGFPEPILYPGSWSDWATSGGEVATGAEPGEPSR